MVQGTTGDRLSLTLGEVHSVSPIGSGCLHKTPQAEGPKQCLRPHSAESPAWVQLGQWLGRPLFATCRQLHSPGVLTRPFPRVRVERQSSLVSLPLMVRTQVPLASFNLNYLLKGSISKYNICILGEHKHSVLRVPHCCLGEPDFRPCVILITFQERNHQSPTYQDSQGSAIITGSSNLGTLFFLLLLFG